MTDENKMLQSEQSPEESPAAGPPEAEGPFVETPQAEGAAGTAVAVAEPSQPSDEHPPAGGDQPPRPAAKPFWRTAWFWGIAAALVVMGIALLQAARPLALDIRVSARPDFTETGELLLTGFDRLTAEEIQAALSIRPETAFAVALARDDPKTAVVTLAEVRNIAYTLDFSVELDASSAQASGGVAPRLYSYNTTVNGPQLTAFYAGGSSIFQYDPVRIVFSQQVDIDSFEENLSISPPTPYHIEYDHATVTLWPERGWEAGRRYTLAIDTGYAGKNGRQLAKRQVFSFGVRGESAVPDRPMMELVSDRDYILSDARDMTLVFRAEALEHNVPVVVETYRVPTLEKYREQSHIYLDYDVPLDILERADTNVYLVENGENRFSLPHPGEGAYIVSARYAHPHTGLETEERAGYLITPISVYMQSSSRDTLVWINSSKTGGPLPGYSISFGDAEEPLGTTGADGTVFLTDRNTGGGEYFDAPRDFRVYDPDGALVYYDMGVGENGYHEERYYSYLFLDRTLYKPEDTVCFWGFVRPYRNNRQSDMPSTVTVTFDPGGLELTREVPLSANGVFSGEFSLERIKSSQYQVQASLHFPDDEEGGSGVKRTFESAYLSVKEYQKPSYVIESNVHDNFYGAGDEVVVTATASFYDGTPVPRFPLEVSRYTPTGGWVSLDAVETDEHGNATFSFPAWVEGRSGLDAGPAAERYRVTIQSDGESITHIGQYSVFPSDILVETAMDRLGNNLAMTVRTYLLDLTSPRLQAAMSDAGSLDNDWLSNDRLLQIARGEPVDVEDMTLSLRWDYRDTRSIRHRYYNAAASTGFSNSYSLDTVANSNPDVAVIDDPVTGEKLVRFSTRGGAATVTDLIYLEDGRAIDFASPAYCRGAVKFKDGAGNSRFAYAHYPSADGYREDWNDAQSERKPVPGFSFEVYNRTSDTDLTPGRADGYDRGYHYYNSSVSVDVGDTLRFTLVEDGLPLPGDGRILYSVIQDGVLQRRVVSGDTFDLTIGMEHGLSSKLVAVYYDQTGVRIINQLDLKVQSDSMALRLAISPDKTSYRPGDTVTLGVRATDSKGRGVSGNLCVAVVDESIFALSEQYVSVLSDLYGDLRYLDNSVRQYFTTYRDELPEQWMDGGKGDGGMVDFYDSHRSNFKDTALFFPTVTNSSGNATVTFKLPDNATSWRITAVEISDSLMGGQSKSNIISTLPFFCRPVLTSKYIEGDDFAMLVQGHGTLLDADSDIEYVVTVTGDGYEKTITASGKAYIAQEINFGKLPVGSYTVLSRAQYLGYADTVELPIDVIKSNLELVVNKPLDLSRPFDISAVRYPVTVTFFNKEAQPFVTSINSLFGHYCMQTSQRLSRVIAKQSLRRSMPDQQIPTYIADTGENIADMQNTDGGIGPTLNSTSDPLLTTYVLLVAPDQFNRNQMSAYYHRQLETLQSAKEIAACHLGLSVLGEMDAKALNGLAAQSASLDVKAYYIAALAVIGETEAAGALYEAHCAPHTARPAANNQSLDWERDAAACWIAASLLHHEDADRLSLHFGSYAWRYRTLYECMIYVSNYQEIIEPSSFRYSVGGQTRSVTLGAGEDDGGYAKRFDTAQLMHALVLSKSELESFRLLDYSDNLTAVAYYIGEPEEIGIEPSPNLRMTKEIEQVDDSTYEVTLVMRFSQNAPTGQYDISDWIPSNTRRYDLDQGRDFSARQEGQNLYISYYHREQQPRIVTYSYRVRKTFTGEAALDTAYLIHGDTGENCRTEKGVFVIR